MVFSYIFEKKVLFYLFAVVSSAAKVCVTTSEELPKLSNESIGENTSGVLQNCINNEEIARIPPELISSRDYLSYNVDFCNILSMESRFQVLCGFYECLVHDYMSNVEYPHKRCLELYSYQQTLYHSEKFYKDLHFAKQDYPNVDIKPYYGSKIEVTGKYFCTRKFRSCFIDKKSQYIYTFYRLKSIIIQQWYAEFYSSSFNTQNSFINNRLQKANGIYSTKLDFKAIIATLIAFIIAAILGIVNIFVLKEVLNESKDACARLFHFYETIMDLVQSFVSFITRLNIDEYFVLLWSNLCYTPSFHYGESNRPQVGRLFAWGVLLSNQTIYCWLAKDRYIAMRYPLEYNNRGVEHARRAKKKVYMLMTGSVLFAVLEITVHQLFLLQVLSTDHICSTAGELYHYNIYRIAELLIELTNWLSVAVVVSLQHYYSISAFVAWYKFTKNMRNETTCQQIREQNESELAKTKQKFTLLVGTCIMNSICVTPWLVLGFLKQSKWFCATAQISTCLHLGDGVEDALTNLCFATSESDRQPSYWTRKFKSVWPVFIVLNCFSVIVHICSTKTYRSALVRVIKRLKPKNKATVHTLPPEKNVRAQP